MTNKKLGLTILRSPIYGDLRLCDIDLDTDYDIVGQGITEGSIRVCFKKTQNMMQKAAEFNNSPIVLCEANHGGKFDSEGSFLSVEAKSVNITVLKASEDGCGIIIRGVEYAGNTQKILITTDSTSYELDVKPYEIFTARLEGNNINKIDALED